MRLRVNVILALIAALVLSTLPHSAAAEDNRLVMAARAGLHPVVVDFGKGQCTQCIKQGEAIEALRGELGEEVGFEFVHVIKEAALTGEYQVFMIPTLVFLDERGDEVYRYVGLLDAAALREKINELWPGRRAN